MRYPLLAIRHHGCQSSKKTVHQPGFPATSIRIDTSHYGIHLFNLIDAAKRQPTQTKPRGPKGNHIALITNTRHIARSCLGES